MVRNLNGETLAPVSRVLPPARSCPADTPRGVDGCGDVETVASKRLCTHDAVLQPVSGSALTAVTAPCAPLAAVTESRRAAEPVTAASVASTATGSTRRLLSKSAAFDLNPLKRKRQLPTVTTTALCPDDNGAGTSLPTPTVGTPLGSDAPTTMLPPVSPSIVDVHVNADAASDAAVPVPAVPAVLPSLAPPAPPPFDTSVFGADSTYSRVAAAIVHHVAPTQAPTGGSSPFEALVDVLLRVVAAERVFAAAAVGPELPGGSTGSAAGAGYAFPSTKKKSVRFSTYDFSCMDAAPSPDVRTGRMRPLASCSHVDAAVNTLAALCASASYLHTLCHPLYGATATTAAALSCVHAALSALASSTPTLAAADRPAARYLASELAKVLVRDRRDLPFASTLARYVSAAIRFRLRRSLNPPLCPGGSAVGAASVCGVQPSAHDVSTVALAPANGQTNPNQGDLASTAHRALRAVRVAGLRSAALAACCHRGYPCQWSRAPVWLLCHAVLLCPLLAVAL